ncbi:hypothetical protein SAMN05192558_108271 [Actinokineospora alba]|uniref:Uncharacterized protein n=1 Tax=Actinokineospora alba TaxID=504798 RepID=A0A1H0S4D9_9PSEU|nr:hypothetical protein SAMN05421871_105282 [Actinokineospora alba]SDP36495.1 hypothetical protein SAMN05192558_108271 [Actinokineospora alba]
MREHHTGWGRAGLRVLRQGRSRCT